jgi:hypothetical protein
MFSKCRILARWSCAGRLGTRNGPNSFVARYEWPSQFDGPATSSRGPKSSCGPASR